MYLVQLFRRLCSKAEPRFYGHGHYPCHARTFANHVAEIIISQRESKGAFGCNLELFQSDVDLCFLPAERTRSFLIWYAFVAL